MGGSVQEGTDYLLIAFIFMENNTERGELQGKISRESPIPAGIPDSDRNLRSERSRLLLSLTRYSIIVF